jgi:hypothetical protein
MEEGKKLSIAQCKKALEESGAKYSEAQVRSIREILYDLGELDYLIFKQMKISEEIEGDSNISEKAA